MAATLVQSAPPIPPADTRFDRRLSEILDFATEVFAEKGYEGASMRDLSRLSGISLAGLYYYFDSKEKLLYSIQKHTFSTIIDRLRETPQPGERSGAAASHFRAQPRGIRAGSPQCDEGAVP